METLEELTQAIMADEQNKTYTEQGIKPLFSIPKTARINIVGQAPGIQAQESGLYWNDPSGDNLRDWMGVSRDFPGHGKSGDLGPRKGFADKWHERVLDLAPNIQLTILVGNYAQHYYLHQKSSTKLTDTVKHYRDYLPDYFPLVHPSPRNNIWQAKNPWFKKELLPDLKELVQKILSQ